MWNAMDPTPLIEMTTAAVDTRSTVDGIRNGRRARYVTNTSVMLIRNLQALFVGLEYFCRFGCFCRSK